MRSKVGNDVWRRLRPRIDRKWEQLCHGAPAEAGIARRQVESYRDTTIELAGDRCAIRELSMRCGKRTVQVRAPGLRMGKAVHGRNVIWKRSSQ